MITPTTPKGTRDFLPATLKKRRFIFKTLEDVFKKYGFQEIETPAMENLKTLSGKYGEEGDRLIFKILNSGDYLSKGRKSSGGSIDNISSAEFAPLIAEKALRYDLTIPFARFVVKHKNELTFPFRRFQIQPVWRADRPQRGRYREFYQCDVDIVGSDSLVLDAELLALYLEAFDKLGLKEITVKINNRKILTALASYVGYPDKVTEICTAIDKFDKIGKEGVEGELQKGGFSESEINKLITVITFEGDYPGKVKYLREIFEGIEIGEKGIAEIEEFIRFFRLMGGELDWVDFDLRLARGLDYYTGTIYEVTANNVKMGSIGGGGRYDNLTQVFSKDVLPGIGISFGADRIFDVMEELDLFPEELDGCTQALLINFGEETIGYALNCLGKLRKVGFSAEVYPQKVKIGKQFGYADKNGIPFVLMIGEEESQKSVIKLKIMESGEQRELSFDQLCNYLNNGIL